LSPSGAERAPPKNVGLQREIHNASRREAQGSGARWRDGAAEEQGRGRADAAAAGGGRGRAEAGRSCSDRGAARARRRMRRKARAGGRNVGARGDAAEVARFGSRDGVMLRAISLFVIFMVGTPSKIILTVAPIYLSLVNKRSNIFDK